MTTLSDMAAMLAAYRDELERGGLSDQALQLKGTELHDSSCVLTTLNILEHMTEDTEASSYVRRHLMGLMRQHLAVAQLAS